MAKATNIYNEDFAREGSISLKNTANDSRMGKTLTVNAGDLFSTDIYMFQSVATYTQGGVTTRYQQYIRSEIPNNASILRPSAIIDQNDRVYTWGNNTSGQLGDNSTTAASTPVSVVGGFVFNQVVSNMNTCVALDDNGYAWSWGSNTFGTLGNNTIAHRSSPVSVFVGNNQFVTLGTCGADSFSGITVSGMMFTWGSNANGQLGDNTVTNRSSPVQVGTGYLVTQGTLALTVDNVCKGWGLNTYGQVGDGTTINRSIPLLLLGAPGVNSNIVKISKSENFGLALDANGYCYAFGHNTYGSLGDGTVDHKSSPVSVLAKKLWQISNGDYHSVALDENGLVWTWGRNDVGQLGNGTTNNGSIPSMINRGALKFIQVGAVKNSSVATDVDGNVWVWGTLADGQTKSNPLMVSNFKARLTKIY
jgi:alpha-tubulin suppressor-like RCC1 family protein